jgi:hypothetical protein
MRRRFNRGRTLALAFVALPLAGCTDEIPTATGGDLFPGGTRPATFEVTVPAEEFFRPLGDFTGYSGAREAGFLLVANRFGGALEANTLAQLAPFPTTVSYTQGGTSRTDSVYTFLRGSVLVPVDTSASEAGGAVRLQVWEVGQAWDPGSATWTLAVDTAGARVPWRTAGGTRGVLLGQIDIPAVRALRDTVRVPLDTVALRRMARPDFRGLLVTAAGAPSRVQLGRSLLVSADVRPASASPDTTLSIRVAAANQTFLFTPEPPTSPGALEAGGIASARTLFRVNLGLRVPDCRGGTCVQRPLREVTLNEVSLLFRPVAVPQGFRPLGTTQLQLRRVAEPELGRRAPLGQVVNDVVFVPGAGNVLLGTTFNAADSVYVVPVTQLATQLAASDTTTAALTLLGEPPAGSFGVAWFAPNPRLRIVYTLSERLSLP